MSRRLVICAPFFALLLSMGALAQQIELSNQIWSAEVIRTKGQPVIPLFDGWFPNEDGSSTICFGFFNMNSQEALNVPLGESNYLETDYPGLDLSGVMLPTHFDPLPPRYRHVFCAFSINVPAGFDSANRITWYLNSNRQELKVPGKVIAPYVLDEPRSNGRGDIAPLVRLGDSPQAIRGRAGIRYPQHIQAKANEPITLSAHIDHPDEEVWVGWSHHSGPGSVEFTNKEYMVESGSSTSTELTISEPGEYVIRMQTIDDVAAFEFYCCHTNAYFSIQVDD
jgi:hypothetical protein